MNHPHDEAIKQDNIAHGRPLCPRCGGTGNEFLSMHRKCEMCRGLGYVHNQGVDE